jgi:hypothetical protein
MLVGLVFQFMMFVQAVHTLLVQMVSCYYIFCFFAQHFSWKKLYSHLFTFFFLLGTSNGIVPMLRVFNNTARYVDQGGGKRKGSFAIYLEPWHADVYDFLELKKNHGKEEARARDLFYAMWVPDLFMKRVKANGEWSLFCPHEAPGLADCHSKTFEDLYERYESEGKARKTVKAQDLWFKIVEGKEKKKISYIFHYELHLTPFSPTLPFIFIFLIGSRSI